MSDFFIKKNDVLLTKCMNELSYVIKGSERFSLTAYKILKSQEIKCLVHCEKLLYNGDQKIVYFSSAYKPLASLFETMKGEEILVILAKLIEAVVSVQNNGFLNCRNIDLSIERIFFDKETDDVFLIYLPLKSPMENAQDEFEIEFRDFIRKSISQGEKFSPIWVKYLHQFVDNDKMSLGDVAKQFFLESIMFDEKKLGIEEKKSMQESKKRILELSLIDDVTDVKLRIREQDYLIGKNALIVDGVLSFNPAISRMHCKVTFHDEKYYVTDLGSVNGTYVNFERVPSQIEIPIVDGDILALANSRFTVKIEEE